MKATLKFSAILLGIFLLQSCGTSEDKNADTDTSAIDSIRDSTVANNSSDAKQSDAPDEATFLSAAAVGGLMEVEAANAAASQSSNTKIKEFAMLMLKDHGKANQDVASLAAKLAVSIPKSLPDDHAMHLRELKKLNDNKFDQQYITMMLADHAKTVKLFTAGQSLSNAEVKAFAIKTLPIIQAHYDKAVTISKTLNMSNTGNGDDLQGVSPSKGKTN
jgi:putative membrane protein